MKDLILKQSYHSEHVKNHPVYIIPRNLTQKVIKHFCSLSKADKKLRFGFNISEYGIEEYVNKINFENGECLAFFDTDKEIKAIAHLSPTEKDYVAELGLSVNKELQGKGVGFSLLIYSVHWANYNKYDFINIEFLSHNTKIVNWVKRAGFPIQKIGFESISVFPTIQGPIPLHIT